MTRNIARRGVNAPPLGVALVAAVILGIIALVAAISAGMGALFMLMWNFTAAGVFHAPRLSFLHAWALWVAIGMVGGAFRAAVARRAR